MPDDSLTRDAAPDARIDHVDHVDGDVPPSGLAADSEQRRAQAWAALLAWYGACGRAHLPWRHTRDPYAILVSEVMLQQTQVERVLPKYHEFLTQFPTIAALAEAPTAEVIKSWAGLGYNLRAVRLQQIARQAVASYGGALPATLDGLLALKGIGRYTAGAVACFALGLPVATVDTNIRRVLWRVFQGVEPAAWPNGTAATRHALALAAWALPAQAAYDWQQALMDLGATVCTSRRPACERCPLATCCAAYAEVGRVSLFPSGEALAQLRDERAAREDHCERAIAEERASYGTSAAHPRPPARPPKMAQPFTHTSRYFRGRILDALRALGPGETLPLARLGLDTRPDYTATDRDWLEGLVRGLARDGLAQLTERDGDLYVALP